MTTPTCEEIALDLPDLVAGRLAEKRAAAVRAHLDGCAACTMERDEAERMVGALRADPTHGTGADPGELFFAGLAKKTMEAARRQPVSRARRAWLRTGLVMAGSLAAAFAVILFASRGMRPSSAHRGGIFLAEGRTPSPASAGAGARAGAGAGAGAGTEAGAAAETGGANEDDVDALLGDGDGSAASDPGTEASPLPALEDMSATQIEQADRNLDDLITQLRSEQRSPG